jgi:predicted DNA-binding transcriptional regulator AlpA
VNGVRGVTGTVSMAADGDFSESVHMNYPGSRDLAYDTTYESVLSRYGVKHVHPHRFSELREASLAPVVADDEVLLTAQQVCTKLGGISQMTLWRWLASDVVQFPRPTLRINNRRYWSAGSIRRWLAERSSDGVAA